MSVDHPYPVEVGGNGETGEPSTGSWAPHATPTDPPFLNRPWSPPKTGRLTRFLSRGITLTLTITPTALMCWVFAPDDLKYELRKHARWVPWAVKYAEWWLRQEGW